MATEHVAYCWRSGKIEIGERCPKTALPLFFGTPEDLKETIQGTARLAYDNETWLVPGVPEASGDDAAMDAVSEYVDWVCDGKAPKVRKLGQKKRG